MPYWKTNVANINTNSELGRASNGTLGVSTPRDRTRARAIVYQMEVNILDSLRRLLWWD